MVQARLTGMRPHMISVPGLVLAAVVLSGCDGAGLPREASRAGSGLELSAPISRGVVERDVPAPQVFQATERGLWDGRPSLGGVWVAHPGAEDPERVLIRNEQTGTEVVGALFRRERDNPGPRFQVSSEAAEALGLLAGQPAEISVVALRVERIETQRSAPAEETTEAEAIAAEAVAPEAGSGGAETAGTSLPIAAEEAPRRSLRDAFRRTPREPETAAPLLAETPDVPLDAPVELVAITAIDPEPAPRRGLRDLFRRRGAEDGATAGSAEATITETALAPAAPLAEPAPIVAPPAPVVAAVPSAPAADPGEGTFVPPPGGAPLAGTAFLSETAGLPAPRARGPQSLDDPQIIAPAADSGVQEERRGLRDLFRRRPAEPVASDGQIPLPDLDTAASG